MPRRRRDRTRPWKGCGARLVRGLRSALSPTLVFFVGFNFIIETSPAVAEKIGVSMPNFEGKFLNLLRNSMQHHAGTIPGVSLQIEDAQNNTSKQVDQIRSFIAQGVDAIIVDPVVTDATPAMTKLAVEAGVPLVYLNRMPSDDPLPAKVSFVGADEIESGTLQMQQVCKLMGGKGNIVLLMGDLATQPARQRIQDVIDVIAKPECSGIQIVDEQTANWDRSQAKDLTSIWLGKNLRFDAVVAHNDEMAIGAINVLKAAGYEMDKVIVAGIDATKEGLAAMKAGELDVTVFQDAAGQASTAVDTAHKLARGESVEPVILLPFELVTPVNMDRYLSKN